MQAKKQKEQNVTVQLTMTRKEYKKLKSILGAKSGHEDDAYYGDDKAGDIMYSLYEALANA